MSFELENLLNNLDTTIRITHSDGIGYLRTIIESDFEVGGGVNYDEPWEAFMDDKGKQLNQAKMLANATIGTGMSNSSLKSLQNTVSTWSGNERPTFSFPATYRRLRLSEPSVSDFVSTFKSYEFPIVDGEDILNSQLQAPGGYNFGENFTAVGTWTLEVGRYFRANNLLLQSAPFSFSKEHTSDGTPLFAKGNISLKPYRQISRDEFKSWFLSPAAINQGG